MGLLHASAAVLVFAILRSEYYLTAGGLQLPQDVEVRAARTGRHHVYYTCGVMPDESRSC